MKKKAILDKFIFYILCILIFFRFIFDGITYPQFNLIFTLSIFFLFILFVWVNASNIDFSYSEFYIFLFLIFSITSSFLSEIKGTGIRYNSYICTHLCLYLLLKNIFKIVNRKKLIFVILLSSFFITTYGIYQRFWGFEETRKFILERQQLLVNQYPDISKYISPTFIDRMLSNRIFSTFVYPNIYAAFLISIIPFLFFFFLNEYKNWLGLFSIFLLFLCFFNLILTESIGGMLIFLFVSHIILLHILFGEQKIKKILPILLILELFLLLLGYKLKILPHIHSLLDRILYWKVSIKIFSLNPFLGIGPENFKYYFLKFKPPEAMEAKHAHSLLFETLVENGLIGTIFLFAFLISIINGFKTKKEKILSYGISYLLLSLLLHNLIDFDFVDPSVAILFFIFGAMIEDKGKILSKRLTKYLLCFIIILNIGCGIKLVKFENSERYRKYSEIERNLNIKINYLEKAEYWDNKNFEIYVGKGDLYFDIWKITKEDRHLNLAISNYNKAIYLNPYLTKGYRKLAYLYEDIKNYNMAEKMYLKLLEIYPNKKLYNLEIAKLYKNLGEEEKFEYFYQKSKKLKGMSIEEGILIDQIEKWIELQK